MGFVTKDNEYFGDFVVLVGFLPLRLPLLPSGYLWGKGVSLVTLGLGKGVWHPQSNPRATHCYGRSQAPASLTGGRYIQPWLKRLTCPNHMWQSHLTSATMLQDSITLGEEWAQLGCLLLLDWGSEMPGTGSLVQSHGSHKRPCCLLFFQYLVPQPVFFPLSTFQFLLVSFPNL